MNLQENEPQPDEDDETGDSPDDNEDDDETGDEGDENSSDESE